jgi:LCP family protein required for cell wall assembly
MIYWQARLASHATDFQARETAGTQGLAQALYDRYHYLPDHYITISQTLFTDMVDSLGGLELDIPQDILSVPPGWSTFHAGQQTLDGKQTLDYVRLLNPTGQAYPSEWDRFSRQNLVLQAILQALLKPQNWSKLPDLIGKFHESTVTDLSPAQLLDLACMLQQVGGKAQLLEPSQDMVHVDGTGRMHANPADLRKLFDALQGEAQKP